MSKEILWIMFIYFGLIFHSRESKKFALKNTMFWFHESLISIFRILIKSQNVRLLFGINPESFPSLRHQHFSYSQMVNIFRVNTLYSRPPNIGNCSCSNKQYLNDFHNFCFSHLISSIHNGKNLLQLWSSKSSLTPSLLH